NSGFAQNVDWSADGRSVLTASTDLSIIIWDAQTGEMIRRLSSAELTNDSGLATVFARFAPDGKHILSTNGSGPGVDGRPSKLLWWDVESGTVMRVLEGHSSTACGIGISPDGTKALSGAGRGELILWDLETGQVLQRFGDVTDDPQLALAHFVEYVEFSPDGRTALTRAFDGKTTLLWDMETFALLHRLEIPDSTWSGAGRSTFSADGRWIAASGSSTVIWDAVTGAFVTTVNRDSTSVDFGPDSGSLLIGSGEIVLWDIYNGAELKRYPIPPEIWFYDLSADGARLVYAIGSNQGEVDSICEIVAVDVESGEQVSRFQHGTISGDGLHKCFVLNLLVSPDGRTVLIARVDGLIELWDLSSGEHLRTFNAATTHVYNLAFSPDGRTIAGAASEVMLWDVATGQEIRRFVGLESEISALRFSPDGRGLLACTSEGEIVLWDVLTGQEQRRYEHAQGNITDVTTFGTSAAFSHDGRMIMIGSSVGTFIWETASGQLLYRLPRSEYAAFAADDRSVFSSSWADAEQAVVQHDLASGEIIRRYPLPSEEAIILHPDGKSFFTKDLSGAIYRWRIDSHAALIAWTLSHRAVRELTCEERVTYRLEPLCGVEGIAATRTPFLTPVPTGVVVQPSATVPPTTPTPTVPPRDVRTAQVGENRGTVSMGDYQSWQYAGRAGEVLTLRVEADKPWSACSESERQSAESGCLDTLLIVTHPDGIHMNFVFQNGAILSPASSDDIDVENSDSLIEGVLLPVDGMYTLTVSGVASQSGGAYRLLIESTPAG
ncbi:MAG: hypothetical protein JNJ61_19140, partial [Anaerolineae bacterium]|nr:hypothetical protein [Anaerolineae bacterium]